MGGDGGTLNNSRREHARLRVTAKQLVTPRVSVRDCALTKEPLRKPVVADRLGQLYNKEALIAFLLKRRTAEASNAFAHLRSLKRDTVQVSDLVCPVTCKAVTEEGAFCVGWLCGCVTAPVKGVKGVEADGCIACGKKGPKVKLGMTMEEREQALALLISERQASKAWKKRKRGKEDVAVQKVAKVSHP